MKKVLSLILVLLIFTVALAGCSSNGGQTDPEDSSAPTPSDAAASQPSPDNGNNGGMSMEELKAAKPNEYINEKIAAGLPVHVGFSFNHMMEETVLMRADGYTAEAAELGITVNVSSADNDIPTQIQQIENLLTMDVALIQCVVSSVDAFEDIAARALEQGTYFCVTGQVPGYEISAYANVDHKLMGQQIAATAIAWLDLQYPDAEEGSVHMAILGHTPVPDLIQRTESMAEAASADPRVKQTFYKDDCNSIDAAYTAAQEAYTVDPDIRLILSFSAAQAVGANNYVTSIPGVNVDEYGIFSTQQDGSSDELIIAAGEGASNSVIRGNLRTGGSTMWEGEINILKKLLLEGVETPYISLDPFTTNNCVGYFFTTIES